MSNSKMKVKENRAQLESNFRYNQKLINVLEDQKLVIQIKNKFNEKNTKLVYRNTLKRVKMIIENKTIRENGFQDLLILKIHCVIS